jgi:hypothetical protein
MTELNPPVISEERVKKGAAKLTQAMTQKQQGRLDGFFKPIAPQTDQSSSTKKRKVNDLPLTSHGILHLR